MSGVLAVLGTPGTREEANARRMLRRMWLRGADQTQLWSGDAGVLGVGRAGWEMGPDFSGGALVLDAHPVVVAADATLYYREDLRRALERAGVVPFGSSPSHLIASGYRAWGPQSLDRLEGDYAFVLWDRERQLCMAARDFAGTRPLYFAWTGDRLIVASSLTTVAEHPAVSRALNRLAIAEDLIGISSLVVRETAFQAVERLPAGCRLLWRPGAPPQVTSFWETPQFDRGDEPDADEAAEELRMLLRAAARERLASEGPTTVWMSGGYDSPAVFASALAASHERAGPAVVPVSMSYPQGDPGREDELILQIAHHLGVDVHWVSVSGVPGMPEVRSWGENRNEPFAHPYENWNLALARGTREAGSRVTLGGNGGDQFFSISPVFLADLVAAGRWTEAWREARAIGFRWRSSRELFHWMVQPVLPATLFKVARRLRGRRLKAHLQMAVPGWLGLDRATTEALWERQWFYHHRRPGESLGSAETNWYLTTSFGQRIVAEVNGLVHQAGAESRSPLYDRRVLQFMSWRPRRDRFANGETKRLLRQAMKGLLPAEHLAGRPSRTGLPSAYLQRARRAAVPSWAESVGTRLCLADLGLVSPEGLQNATRRYLAHPRWEGTLGAELFNTFTAEFWIRAHAEGPGAQALVA